jgi:hypothetical protein
MRAEPRDLLDFVHDAFNLSAVDRMRRAERQRCVEPGFDDIAGDDRRAAGDFRRHDGTQANGAAAGDNNGCSRPRMQAVKYGAGAGLQAAAERADESEIHIVGYGDKVVHMHDGMGRKRGLSEKRADFRVPVVQARCTVEINGPGIDLEFLSQP